MIIRDSCLAIVQTTIAWIQSPLEAYRQLIAQYAPTQSFQRDFLYKKFHSYTFQGYQGTIVEFNSEFSSTLNRLGALGVLVKEEDQVNCYLNALEPSFNEWVKRKRDSIRIQSAGGPSFRLNLAFLMADILAELQLSADRDTEMTLQGSQGPKKPKGPKGQGKGKGKQKETAKSSGSARPKGPKQKGK